jgi:hypothetical protein
MGWYKNHFCFDKFDANTTDRYRTFYKDGQTKEIKDSNFTDGYAILKFRNVDVNGKQGSDKTGFLG